MHRPHRRTRFEIQLIRENDGLKTKICCLRRELENREGAVGLFCGRAGKAISGEIIGAGRGETDRRQHCEIAR
jgi:hypothetical protein